MKYLLVLMIISSSLFITACNTTTDTPQVNNLQPSQYEQDQAKLQSALHS